MRFAAFSLCSLLLASAAAGPAFAQDGEVPPENVAVAADDPQLTAEPTIFDDTWVTLGLGVGYAPNYEGADENSVFPAPLAQGSVGGFEFGARGPGLFVDLVRDDEDAKVKILAGPLVRVRLERHGKIKDTAVAALGKRDVAVEVGGSFGLTFPKVLNPFDRLIVSSDVQWDVAGAHDGRLITPSIAYLTPLSKSILVLLSGSATHVDDNYARTYYSVDAAGSVASGLPVFNAKGGWKNWSVSSLVGYDLSGDARDGGWGLFGIVNYSKLIGDAARTPITAIRGTPNQWLFVGGVSYTF